VDQTPCFPYLEQMLVEQELIGQGLVAAMVVAQGDGIPFRSSPSGMPAELSSEYPCPP